MAVQEGSSGWHVGAKVGRATRSTGRARRAAQCVGRLVGCCWMPEGAAAGRQVLPSPDEGPDSKAARYGVKEPRRAPAALSALRCHSGARTGQRLCSSSITLAARCHAKL